MKKLFTVVALFAVIIVYSSCTSGQKPNKSSETEDLAFGKSLSNEDTLKVLKLADECMELLKKQNIDQAIAMLYEYDEVSGGVKSLSSESEGRLRHNFRVFPVIEYEREYFSIMEEGVNDIRYKVWFAKEDNPEKNGEPVVKLMFNPVFIDGQWYLCVKNPDQPVDELRQ